MADAVARAADVPAPAVRRAAMLGGDLPAVAAAALAARRRRRWREFRLQVGRPVGPMLAQTATDVGDALDRLGGTAVFEAKLDGARVQIHRNGDDVAIFTRSLDDVTARLPEVVEATLALPVDTLIADGEAIALRPDGRPHRSRSPRRASAAASTSTPPAPRSRCRCSSSTCCTSTASTCSTSRARQRAAALAGIVPDALRASTGWSPPTPTPRRRSSSARWPPGTRA